MYECVGYEHTCLEQLTYGIDYKIDEIHEHNIFRKVHFIIEYFVSFTNRMIVFNFQDTTPTL